MRLINSFVIYACAQDDPSTGRVDAILSVDQITRILKKKKKKKEEKATG